MRICQACNKEKWPVDEHGMQQACLSEECIKNVLCIIEDLHESDRTRILLGYAFAIQRRAEMEEKEFVQTGNGTVAQRLQELEEE